jgi:hypothetical protein
VLLRQFVQRLLFGGLLGSRACGLLAQGCELCLALLPLLLSGSRPGRNQRPRLWRKRRLLLLPFRLGLTRGFLRRLSGRRRKNRIGGDGLGQRVSFLPPLPGFGLLRRVRTGRVVKEENARRDFDSLKLRVWIERPRGTPLEILGRIIRARLERFFELCVADAGESQRCDYDCDSFRCSGFGFYLVRSGLLCVFDSPATSRANEKSERSRRPRTFELANGVRPPPFAPLSGSAIPFS